MVTNMNDFITPDMFDDGDNSFGDDNSQNSNQMRGHHRSGRKNQRREDSPEDNNGGKTISQRQVRKLLDKNPLDLNLASSNLYDWDELFPLAPKMVDMLKIDLSKNNLVNIDFLCSFTQLRQVVCCDNYLRSVNLELNHLEELDLRNNFIEVMPVLSTMPKLQTLLINANNVRVLRLTVSTKNFNYLTKLVIKNNKIAFNSDQLSRFLKKLKQFKALRYLSMEENPYIRDPAITQ